MVTMQVGLITMPGRVAQGALLSLNATITIIPAVFPIMTSWDWSAIRLIKVIRCYLTLVSHYLTHSGKHYVHDCVLYNTACTSTHQ